MASMIQALADALATRPLRETLLIAPSRRVGRDWIDHAARLSGGVAAVRATTLDRLVRDYAEPELAAKKLRLASKPEKMRLVASALARVARNAVDGDSAYFTSLPPSFPLVDALLSAWDDVECADARDGARALIQSCGPKKGAELAALLRRSRADAARKGVAAPGETHRAAIASASSAGALPRLVIPHFIWENCTALERRFLLVWPEDDRVHLPDDTDDMRASLAFASADNPINEARDIFRQLLRDEIPLDQVEVVCLDPASSIPALCRAALETFGGAVEELPLTSAPGIPGSYARPARLLAAWLEWLENGTPTEGLARMLDARLLDEGWRDSAPGISSGMLAARLRALPVRGGIADYRERLGGRALATSLDRAEQWLANRLSRIVPGNPPAVLAAAEALLAVSDKRDAKLDAYARLGLLDAIRLWEPFCDWAGFDAVLWLGNLLSSFRVMGMGAMPGRMHIADIASGGHTGRRHTFVTGMDDGHFPGQPRQDPVLLDAERASLSPHLRPSAHWRKQREHALLGLLSRVRGTVRLSYAAHANGGGREQFPAPLYAALRDAHNAVPSAEATLLPAPDTQPLDRREDWLTVLVRRRPDAPDSAMLSPYFPNLAAGAHAEAERASDRFTEYDGFVPEAGAEWNPSGGVVFSPTHLEELAACPLHFFFKRVLAIRPPDRADIRPGRWLPGNERGTLLHDLFQNFLDDLDRDSLPVDDDTREEAKRRLSLMLDNAILRYSREYPPKDDLAFRRETAELREAAAIFLHSEKERQTQGRPLYREVALGGAKSIRTRWDRETPIPIPLSSGVEILLQGRVDRIDRLDRGGLAVLDYKTGRSDKFSRADPFQQGRHLQPLLYTRMLERALSDMGRPEPVASFSYFFPMPRDEGLVLAYPRAALNNDGMAIVDSLAMLLSDGKFPFTTDKTDVAFSDYLPLFGDPAALALRARDKCAADPALSVWRDIRGIS